MKFEAGPVIKNQNIFILKEFNRVGERVDKSLTGTVYQELRKENEEKEKRRGCNRK
jgi:hypothetical protein